MKDFENDLIYYPNPDPVKEPRFILKSVDELEKSFMSLFSYSCIMFSETRWSLLFPILIRSFIPLLTVSMFLP